MNRKDLKRKLSLLLAGAVLVGSLSGTECLVQAQEINSETASEAAGQVSESLTTTVTSSGENGSYVSEMISNNYTKVSAGYNADAYQGERITYSLEDCVTELTNASFTTDSYTQTYTGKVVDMQIDSSVTLSLEVPQTALYWVNFDYLSYDDSILPIEMSFLLDGAYPFYEARQLRFETTWISADEIQLDRYGNEIVTIPDKLIRWENKYLMDSSYRNSRPLCVQLEKGTHTIVLTLSEGSILLGNISLDPVKEVNEAKSQYNKAEGSELITIEAEEFTYRNDSSIRPVAEFDTDLTPLNVKKTVLNTIDADSFTDAGQRVSYEFEVEKEGDYNLAFQYRQDAKKDLPVFVDIAIDNELPDKNFQSYAFAYNSDYKRVSMKDESGQLISVHLTEGTHTISFTINNDNIRYLLEALDEIMAGINDLSLEVTKVAGTNKDKYRDLNLQTYIPDILDRLNGWADELDALQEQALVYNTKVEQIAALSSMSVAASTLRSLAEKPDEIAYRVAELSSSKNSANQYLANTVDTLIANDFSLDKIFVYQSDAKLPKNMGFFQSMLHKILRFFHSFFDQAYSTSNTDVQHLQVWVNRSRQYVEIMQKMIDESFTPRTGIEVDLCVMPDQYKLVLSNASNDEPDVATGLNYAQPYELAIRGALVDMTQFSDFKEVASAYSEGLFIPLTISDSVYAMPETMNFWVLFYREDVLDKLGLSVPQTIEDVIDMLPELQMRGLNFYYPTAGMTTMRNFHGTTPLIYQNGGAIYNRLGASLALGEEEAIQGFTTLTELFTIYNLPVDIPNFYQHFRNGDLPIGIADFGTYNMLKNAAPEIANSWSIALMPGVEKEDGTIDRSSCGGAETTIMFEKEEGETLTLTDGSRMERKEASWKFVKWWSDASTQTEFGQTLQISYGDEYMWNTANREAFNELPWDTQDKKVIAEQNTWVVEPARLPGSYLVEREMSNAFNNIVNDGDSLRQRVDEAIKTCNREIDRKMEEFGYIDSAGNTIKEYVVPTLESIRTLLGRDAQ